VTSLQRKIERTRPERPTADTSIYRYLVRSPTWRTILSPTSGLHDVCQGVLIQPDVTPPASSWRTTLPRAFSAFTGETLGSTCFVLVTNVFEFYDAMRVCWSRHILHCGMTATRAHGIACPRQDSPRGDAADEGSTVSAALSERCRTPWRLQHRADRDRRSRCALVAGRPRHSRP